MNTAKTKQKLWTPYDRPRRAIILSIFKRRGYSLSVGELGKYVPGIYGYGVWVARNTHFERLVGHARTKKHAQEICDRWNKSLTWKAREMIALASVTTSSRYQFDAATAELLHQLEYPRLRIKCDQP